MLRSHTLAKALIWLLLIQPVKKTFLRELDLFSALFLSSPSPQIMKLIFFTFVSKNSAASRTGSKLNDLPIVPTKNILIEASFFMILLAHSRDFNFWS